MTDNRDPCEQIAELLGDPLPADWKSELAIEARAQHLAGLACVAADAGLALIVHHAQHRGQVLPDDLPVEVMAGAVCDLEKGLQNYTHNTQRGDGAAIVYTAIWMRLGSLGADWVTAAINKMRAKRAEMVAEIVAQQEA